MVKATDWTTKLRTLAGNISTIADSQSVYLHRRTGTILDIEKLSYGEIRVEVPVPQANLSQIFLIGSKGQNIILKVKMKNRDIEKLMVSGEIAFEELWEVFKDATIIARPAESIKTKNISHEVARPYIMDKASGFQ